MLKKDFTSNQWNKFETSRESCPSWITPNNKNPDHPGGELLQPLNKTAPIPKVPTPLDHFNGNICEER